MLNVCFCWETHLGDRSISTLIEHFNEASHVFLFEAIYTCLSPSTISIYQPKNTPPKNKPLKNQRSWIPIAWGYPPPTNSETIICSFLWRDPSKPSLSTEDTVHLWDSFHLKLVSSICSIWWFGVRNSDSIPSPLDRPELRCQSGKFNC